MSELVKTIVTSKAELEGLLEDLDFTISNSKVYWAAAGTTGCYWEFTNNELNFKTSENQTAFTNNLTDFANGKNAGVIFTYLSNGGCILYITPLDTDISITELNFSCTIADDNLTLKNGLMCITPPEKDNHWRFIWRCDDRTTTQYMWCVDNTAGIVTEGIEVPYKQMINVPLIATLVKMYLECSEWSKHVFVQVLGQVEPPGIVFKINGQKFITFMDDDTPTSGVQYRTPCFKLPPQEASLNPPTSTAEYSPLLIYKPKDYCIYEGLLYRCVQGTNAGEGFDENKWVLTTVYQELNNG